jgi:hypothetical protein
MDTKEEKEEQGGKWWGIPFEARLDDASTKLLTANLHCAARR